MVWYWEWARRREFMQQETLHRVQSVRTKHGIEMAGMKWNEKQTGGRERGSILYGSHIIYIHSQRRWASKNLCTVCEARIRKGAYHHRLIMRLGGSHGHILMLEGVQSWHCHSKTQKLLLNSKIKAYPCTSDEYCIISVHRFEWVIVPWFFWLFLSAILLRKGWLNLKKFLLLIVSLYNINGPPVSIWDSAITYLSQIEYCM